MDGITLSYMALDVFIVLLGINVGGGKGQGIYEWFKRTVVKQI